MISLRWTFVFLIVGSIGLSSLAGRASGEVDEEPWKCVLPGTPKYPSGTYESVSIPQAQASSDLLLFAVAMFEAYENDDVYGRAIRVEKLRERGQPGWVKQAPIQKATTDLYANYYFREPQGAQEFHVLIAFRGTEFWNSNSWIANSSWVTRFFIRSQYDDALAVFREIEAKARARAGAKRLIFAATGHSLGGGLSMRLAYNFPCVTAVLFDTSPVARGDGPVDHAIVIKVFERLDPLTFVGGGRNNMGI